MEKINLDIQPKASIYSIFTRLNYYEWYALAEFVDNSTASYYQHENELLKKAHSDKLVVEINYDTNADIITIEDNAYGMELKDFQRAILLDAKPDFQGGRNEFGLGLKTAATWFGRHWSVESTEYGSENLYRAYIDLDELIENDSSIIKIEKFKADYDEHYTKIIISKLNRKINTSKIKNKIREILEGMYRRDLLTGKIEILFNGITLSFKEYTPLNFRGQTWKKDISFSFTYLDKVYNVKGFVGIMDPGSFDKSGFALFRRNRVVIGGLGQNYKPVEIFGQVQSQVSLKLYGEIDMDCFDINQAKDGFSWDSELEESFIKNLKLAIMDYISVAKMAKKDREVEEYNNLLNANQKEENADEEGYNINDDSNINVTELEIDEDKFNVDKNNLSNENSEQSNEESEQSEEHNEEDDKNDYTNCYHLEYSGDTYDVFWQIIDKKYNLYDYYQNENKLVINLNHDFNKLTAKSERLNISKIIMAYIIGEAKAKFNSTTEGYVPTSVIRNQMSKVLLSIKEIK